MPDLFAFDDVVRRIDRPRRGAADACVPQVVVQPLVDLGKLVLGDFQRAFGVAFGGEHVREGAFRACRLIVEVIVALALQRGQLRTGIGERQLHFFRAGEERAQVCHGVDLPGFVPLIAVEHVRVQAVTDGVKAGKPLILTRVLICLPVCKVGRLLIDFAVFVINVQVGARKDLVAVLFGLIFCVFDPCIGSKVFADGFGHDADLQLVDRGGVERLQIPCAEAVEDRPAAGEASPAAAGVHRFAVVAGIVGKVVPVGAVREERRIRFDEFFTVDAVHVRAGAERIAVRACRSRRVRVIRTGLAVPRLRSVDGVIRVADDVRVVAEQPSGQIQRAFVLVVAVYIVGAVAVRLRVVEPCQIAARHVRAVQAVGAALRMHIICDRVRHGAVFGIRIGDIAEAFVIRSRGVVCDARIVGVARPAEDGRGVPVVFVRHDGDGIFRRERRVKGIVIEEVVRIVDDRLPDVDKVCFFVRRAAVRVRNVHAVRGRRGVGFSQIFGKEVLIIRKAEGREIFREGVDTHLFAVFRGKFAGRLVIGDPLADRFAVRRIQLERVGINIVDGIFAPIDVLGQIERDVADRIRTDLLRGDIEHVVQGARIEQVGNALKIGARHRFIVQPDIEGLQPMLFCIVCRPRVDHRLVCRLVGRRRKDERRQFVVAARFGAAGEQPEAQRDRHERGDSHDRQFFEKPFHA